MSTWWSAIQWAALLSLLAIYIAGLTLLQGIVRRSAWKNAALLVPVGGVFVLAAAACGLAETGAFCAFCD